MRRLFTGRNGAALSLSAATLLTLGASSGAVTIPRPFPGGPGAHSAAWHSVRGISRALMLTIARGESVSPSERVVLLQCSPTGGTHSRATEACRLLEPIAGDIAELRLPRDRTCAKHYEPVTVSASGIWDGHHLWFERTFGNRCELATITGAVFNF